MPLWWLARVVLLPLPLLGAARPLLAVVVLRPAVELVPLALPAVELPARLVVELPVGVVLGLVVELPGLLAVVLGLAKPAPALLGPLLVGLLPRLTVTPALAPALVTVAPVNPGSAAQPAARTLPVRVVPRPVGRIPLVVLLVVLPREDLPAADLLGVLRPGRPRPAVARDLVAVRRVAAVRVDLAWTLALPAALNPPARGPVALLRVPAVRVDLAWTPGLPAALSHRVPVTAAHLVAVQRPAVPHRAPATTPAVTPGSLVDRVQPRHSS